MDAKTSTRLRAFGFMAGAFCLTIGHLIDACFVTAYGRSGGLFWGFVVGLLVALVIWLITRRRKPAKGGVLAALEDAFDLVMCWIALAAIAFASWYFVGLLTTPLRGA
jgi:hypothetical protein